VQGVFELGENWITQELRELGISLDDGELMLGREIAREGKGRFRANGLALSRPIVERASGFLFDLHGQHDHQLLLRPAEQLTALDEWAGLSEERESYAKEYREWRRITREIEDRTASSQETEKLSLLRRFQLHEIQEVDPQPGELGSLLLERKRLEASELLRRSAAEIASRLVESESSVHDALAELGADAAAARAHDPSWESLVQSLEEMRVQAQELGREAERLGALVEDDPERLERIRARIRALQDLLRKHGPDEASLFSLWERLRAEEQDPRSDERRLSALRAREQEISATLAAAGADLSKKRKGSALRLSRIIARSLAHLGLEQARFEIAATERESSAHVSAAGQDAVEFLFSANAGESLRPLRQIASGGELSRVMLALQSILGRKRGTPTIVFDEIDQGVGGGLAARIGDALAELSSDRQVICITHLPQVASRAQAHFRVSKREEKGRTIALVEQVEGEERVREIARMLGGMQGIAVDHARELLRGART
jgi:DNA repair protein RecN (Recombination protein N)